MTGFDPSRMNGRTLEAYAAQWLPIPLHQTLITLRDAIVAVGWDPEVDRPECCGQPVDVEAFIGCAYHAQCDVCGVFVSDVLGPTFGNAWVAIPEAERFDAGEFDRTNRWIAGWCDPLWTPEHGSDRPAIAIEARRAATGTGAVNESADPKGIAQTTAAPSPKEPQAS